MRKTCNKCRFWKRDGSAVGAGMCVRFLQASGAADTCAEWKAKK